MFMPEQFLGGQAAAMDPDYDGYWAFIGGPLLDLQDIAKAASFCVWLAGIA
jgi:hypothetical protein